MRITCLWAVALLAVPAIAETFVVGPGGQGVIQDAIDTAEDGDEILILPGTYTDIHQQVIDTDGKSLWIHSSDGADVTFIDGQSVRRGAFIGSEEGEDTIIEGLTFSACYAQHGAGLWATNSSPQIIACVFSFSLAYGHGGGAAVDFSASPTFSNCLFLMNSADDGGGVYNSGEGPTFTDCSFEGNWAYEGGGASNYAATGNFTDCTFTNNYADLGGGGMLNQFKSSPMVASCTFKGNQDLYYGGGGIFNWGSSPTIVDCTFIANQTDTANGGAIHNLLSDATIQSCTFQGNAGWYAGAIYNKESIVTVNECDFIENTSDNTGGAMVNQYGGEVWISLCSFSRNTAASGGGAIDSLITVPWVAYSSFCENSPNDFDGKWQDVGGNTFSDSCGSGTCLADVDGDGLVNVNDLLVLISDWGPCPGCDSDINDSGSVDVTDLLLVIDAWGPCP